MFQSSSVFSVMVSTDAPQAPPASLAITVISPASLPVLSIVMRTPGTSTPPLSNDWSCRWPCVGSGRLHVAALPSAVTAGIENVCAVLPGMNAEYIGEKTMGTVGVVHVPGCVLTAPASTGGVSPPSTPLDVPTPPPSADVLPPLLPPEHAAAIVAAPTAATPRASAILFRFDRVFMITPSSLEKRKFANHILGGQHEQAMTIENLCRIALPSLGSSRDLRNFSGPGTDGPARGAVEAIRRSACIGTGSRINS